MKTQPWISSVFSDLLFVIAPPFISLGIIFLFPSLFQDVSGLSTISWVVLVLMIDVAHVYSTLFRTYLHRQSFNEQRTVFISIPLISFAVAVLLYNTNAMYFWRVLAYLAVFHFIRQQYGFMRIYSRKEIQESIGKFIDKLTIYTATIYPIVYWHINGPRNFSWFVEGDFYMVDLGGFTVYATALYCTILIVYLIKEIRLVVQTKQFNIPRNLLILGTTLSWYVGIVYLNGDLAFTLLNVVSHGVPYMFLVWVYGKKDAAKNKTQQDPVQRILYRNYGWALFVGAIITLAWFEEGLWDVLVWKEHLEVFPAFVSNISLNDPVLLSIIIPLFSLPQITHYIIDGYIWKNSKQ